MPYFCDQICLKMRKLLYIFSLLFFFTACNDGDVIDVELEFDETLTLCNLSTTEYLIYKTKSDPFESLSLVFPNNDTNDLIFNPVVTPYEEELTINNTSVKFNYRTYNGDPDNLFCQLIPDPNTTITNDYYPTSGTVETLTTFYDDDEDGIPTEVEDLNLDGDNNPATNPTDSDGDGIPDYIDADDDNDNILTINEGVNYSEEFGLLNAQNTDGQGQPDYLDPDDDGDGVLTQFEDANGDGNPRNDLAVGSNVARYLDNLAMDPFPGAALAANSYKRFFRVEFKLFNINIDVLSTDELDLGVYESSITLPETDD
jgi:hypothetical protein